MPYRDISKQSACYAIQTFSFFFAALQSVTKVEFTIVFGPNTEGMRV